MNAIKKMLYSVLPSKIIKTDCAIAYNEVGAIKPIMLHELSLIFFIKQQLLDLRKKIKYINIERSYKKMSLIVPYRNREEHLQQFIPYISSYLREQQIDFEIIIVEQADQKPFNRAKLMNIGVLNSAQDSEYFVFHDVDLMPDEVDYRYCNHSLKLFTFIKQPSGVIKEYKQTNFGGATLVPKDIFYTINGFSNNYWQWGSEDDDFLMRHLFHGYIPLYDSKGKYTTLPHEHALKQDLIGNATQSTKILKQNQVYRRENKHTFSKFKRGITLQVNDGINTVQYHIVNQIKDDSINHIYVTL